MNARCLLLLVTAAFGACHREKRELHPAPGPELPHVEQTTALRAGGAAQATPEPFADERNAYSISQGKQLFTRFNCSTCHASGGGDIGPPLKDEKWIYGSDPAQISASIVQGRPNGMPAFRDRFSESQLRQIVAYVRSLGGLTSTIAAPGRNDDINEPVPENSAPRQTPVASHPR